MLCLFFMCVCVHLLCFCSEICVSGRPRFLPFSVGGFLLKMCLGASAFYTTLVLQNLGVRVSSIPSDCPYSRNWPHSGLRASQSAVGMSSVVKYRRLVLPPAVVSGRQQALSSRRRENKRLCREPRAPLWWHSHPVLKSGRDQTR